MGLELSRTKRLNAPFQLVPPDREIDLGYVEFGDSPVERCIVVDAGTTEAGTVSADSSWVGYSPNTFEKGITPIRLAFRTATLPPGKHRAVVTLTQQAQRMEIELTLEVRARPEARAAAGDDPSRALVRALEQLGGGRRVEAIDEIDFDDIPEKSDIGFELTDLLTVMLKHSASDLHLKVGAPATVRIDGDLIPIGETPLTHRDCMYLILSNMSGKQRRRLHAQRYLDYAINIPGARMRANAFVQKGTLSASYRLLRTDMPTFDTLGLPSSLKKLAVLNDGLILITGPAGSGKSTTLAAMVDYINGNYKKHIITVEDPIEFLHSDKQSLVTQREIGTDIQTYTEAMRQSLRQDPNVLLVGEMRDAETMLTACQAAETGHLVLSTLHTPNTTQAVDRIIDSFTGDQQKQFRMLFSRVLRAVISQRLITRSDDRGRCVAVEILIVTPTVSSLILDAKTHEIYDHIKEGSLHGMQTFSQSLLKLYQSNLIEKVDAYRHADQPSELRHMIDGHITGSDYNSLQNPSKML